MGIKLFVDDIRREPEGWVRARTVTEAIRLLATQDVDEVSLDHDISCRFNLREAYTGGDKITPIEHSSEETFEPVARYLALMKTYHEYAEGHCTVNHKHGWPIIVRFHTSNPTGGQKMADILEVPYRFANYPTDYLHDRLECPYVCQPKTLCGQAHHKHPCEWCR